MPGQTTISTRFQQWREEDVNWRNAMWSFVLPMGLSAALMAMYFSGNPLLESIISAPDLQGVALRSRREFGLLENLQNVVLVAMVIAAIVGYRRHTARLARMVMVLVALGAGVLFLEEIDYGLHVYEFAVGKPHDDVIKNLNLHNAVSKSSQLKLVLDAGTIALFGVMPLLFGCVRQPALRPWVPDRCFLLTLTAALLTRTLCHHLDDQGLGRGLEGNMSEFRELLTYYMGLLYVLQVSLSAPSAAQTTPIPCRLASR